MRTRGCLVCLIHFILCPRFFAPLKLFTHVLLHSDQLNLVQLLWVLLSWSLRYYHSQSTAVDSTMLLYWQKWPFVGKGSCIQCGTPIWWMRSVQNIENVWWLCAALTLPKEGLRKSDDDPGSFRTLKRSVKTKYKFTWIERVLRPVFSWSFCLSTNPGMLGSFIAELRAICKYPFFVITSSLWWSLSSSLL